MDMKKFETLSKEEKKIFFDKMTKEVESVLKGDVNMYQLSKRTGIAYPILFRYRKNKNKVENMTISTFKKILDVVE